MVKKRKVKKNYFLEKLEKKRKNPYAVAVMVFLIIGGVVLSAITYLI